MAQQKGARRNTFTPTPKSIKESFKLNDKPFRWTFQNCLWAHRGWQNCKDLKFFAEHIISKLQEFEEMKWQNILDASGGKTEGHGNNNHFILGSNLPREERRKFIELGYMRDFEKVFSLRLSGKERLIGIVDLNIFKVLWYDANHEFF